MGISTAYVIVLDFIPSPYSLLASQPFLLTGPAVHGLQISGSLRPPETLV